MGVEDNKVPWELLEDDMQSKLGDDATVLSDVHSDNQSFASFNTTGTHNVGFCCEMIYVFQDMYRFFRCSNSGEMIDEDKLQRFATDLENMAEEFVEQGPIVVVRWIR